MRWELHDRKVVVVKTKETNLLGETSIETTEKGLSGVVFLSMTNHEVRLFSTL